MNVEKWSRAMRIGIFEVLFQMKSCVQWMLMASLPPTPWHMVWCDHSELREQLGQVPQTQERRLWRAPTVGDPTCRPQFLLLAEDAEETQFPTAGTWVSSVMLLCSWTLPCIPQVSCYSAPQTFPEHLLCAGMMLVAVEMTLVCPALLSHSPLSPRPDLVLCLPTQWLPVTRCSGALEMRPVQMEMCFKCKMYTTSQKRMSVYI